jgi:hypothetical protein
VVAVVVQLHQVQLEVADLEEVVQEIPLEQLDLVKQDKSILAVVEEE